MRERTRKYFGDIVSAERIDAPRVIPVKESPDDDLINEILWDAFNGRGKRAARVRENDATADEYIEEVEEDIYL